jgi:hypothetical protein
MLYLDPLVNNQDVKRLRGHLEEEYLQMAPSSWRIGTSPNTWDTRTCQATIIGILEKR